MNTARGGVIDEKALLNLKTLPTLCLDVWEHEPTINRELMQQCFIATPHIAGYSTAAKRRATFALYEAFKSRFDWPDLKLSVSALNETSKLSNEDVLSHYNPLHDTKLMKNTLAESAQVSVDFEKLRRGYGFREEF